MRRRACMAALLVLGFFAMGPQDGCIPQRVDVSPDGRLMFFSMKSGDFTNIYALDTEKERLHALTDNPGEEGWCMLDEDGDGLFYVSLAEESSSVHYLSFTKDPPGPSPAGGGISPRRRSVLLLCTCLPVLLLSAAGRGGQTKRGGRCILHRL